MHLRAYTLQTVFFYPGKSLYGKTLLSPNAKLFLPLAMGKVLSFEIPGNIYFLSLGYASGKIFPIGNEWNVTDIFTSKDAIFAISTFARVEKHHCSYSSLNSFTWFHLTSIALVTPQQQFVSSKKTGKVFFSFLFSKNGQKVSVSTDF